MINGSGSVINGSGNVVAFLSFESLSFKSFESFKEAFEESFSFQSFAFLGFDVVNGSVNVHGNGSVHCSGSGSGSVHSIALTFAVMSR